MNKTYDKKSRHCKWYTNLEYFTFKQIALRNPGKQTIMMWCDYAIQSKSSARKDCNRKEFDRQVEKKI